MNEFFFSVSEYSPELIEAVILTLQLMGLSLLFGLLLALLLTTLLLTEQKIFKYPIQAFIFFIRGTPLLIQIFLIYFGLSQFDWLRESFAWHFFEQPFLCAVLAFTLNSAAYTTILFKESVQSIPRGEVDACKALGMSFLLRLRRIIFPRALRQVLPAYSNEIIIILKSTALASTITLLDLMGATREIISETYMPMEFFLLAGAIYLSLNVIIITFFKALERYWKIS